MFQECEYAPSSCTVLWSIQGNLAQPNIFEQAALLLVDILDSEIQKTEKRDDECLY